MFSESFIPESEAVKLLEKRAGTYEGTTEESRGVLVNQQSGGEGDGDNRADAVGGSYERLLLKGRPYICSLPTPKPASKDQSNEATSKAVQEKDLATAADRGWELLQDLNGKCIYFVSGWWSYSFCYNAQIKQFHQLPPGNGGPVYPPQEDPSTPSYVLGKFKQAPPSSHGETKEESVTTELQTKGETRYLVQKLGGGTTCDLTGKDRKVEVQFHCHPQSADRIGWIKEVATCAYVMIIYTPRLCNDIAFSPPRKNKAHGITCREILRPDEIADRKDRHESQTRQTLRGTDIPLMVGGVEVGGMKEVGRDGRHIEKGRVVTPPSENVDTVAMQKDGKIQKLSKEDLRKLNLDPAAVEKFRKEIQDIAGPKDWRVERVDDDQGHTQLRGMVAGDEDEENGPRGTGNDDEQNPRGSEEGYNEQL